MTGVCVLAGGVGAARLLRGMCVARPPQAVTAVVNTGDDTVMHGLSISPDLDTITYTLAGAIDPERGWGLAGETWNANQAVGRYASFRPDASSAGDNWFSLGDRDLATHMYRTARLDEGASLTEVTDEIARAWGIACRLLPMTNAALRTMITLAEAGEEVSFQDYFVRLRHGVPISGVRFDGDDRRLTPEAQDALESSEAVVIAPSNPLVSIAPIRALDGVDSLLARRREQVVAISPIVGGAALKGPADRMLTELGFEPSVVAVARLYAPIASVLVIDHADAALADAVEAEGMRCVVTDTVMSSLDVSTRLAQTALGSL